MTGTIIVRDFGKAGSMKVLVVEYVTGGGLRSEDLPPSLAREGGLMRRVLMDDLLAADTPVELIVLSDDRFPVDSGDARLCCLPVGGEHDFGTQWRRGLDRCDVVWLIAPESGGILAELSAEAEAAGLALLSNPASAVRLAASKSATIARLQAHGLPVVETLSLKDYRERSMNGAMIFGDSVVIKPDDGVGCEGARVVSYVKSKEENADGDRIIQPLLEGESLSLSVLFCEGEARLLSVNRQLVARHGEGFVLAGCHVNALSDSDGRWQQLASGIARAMPELRGYAGADLILTEQGPRILEINPRLTTSYAGIRRATGLNPATLVLDLMHGVGMPPFQVVKGMTVKISLEPTDAH